MINGNGYDYMKKLTSTKIPKMINLKKKLV